MKSNTDKVLLQLMFQLAEHEKLQRSTKVIGMVDGVTGKKYQLQMVLESDDTKWLPPNGQMVLSLDPDFLKEDTVWVAKMPQDILAVEIYCSKEIFEKVNKNHPGNMPPKLGDALRVENHEDYKAPKINELPKREPNPNSKKEIRKARILQLKDIIAMHDRHNIKTPKHVKKELLKLQLKSIPKLKFRDE